MSRLRLLAPLVLTLGALGTAGCAAAQLDPAKVEDAVRERARGVTFAEVVCPSDIAAVAGGTFECVGTGDNGTRVIVTVTQLDGEGDVTLSYGRGVVQTDTVASMLDADVEATLEADVELDCPEAVLLPDNTGTFTCDGVDEGGDRFTISVRVTDGAVAPDGWDLAD